MIEVDDTKPVADDAAAAATTTTKEHGGAAAASVEAHATSGDDTHAAASSFLEPLVLQRDIEPGRKAVYRVEELLQYHDGHFIENTYTALLGRAPFETERARELDELRGGRTSKIEIIERLLSAPEAGAAGGVGRVRVEGLPSPLMRRLRGVPIVGYWLRLASALVRLPVLMRHQQQFEVYALAQQQLIADHVNQVFTPPAPARSSVAAGDDATHAVLSLSQHNDLIETVSMFSDALLDLSNGHAELQAQVQTQGEQVQAALADLTHALTAQQRITETLRREQQATTGAQQEFLIQEQRVIVETQKVVLEELREELHALAQRQADARALLDAEVRRLQTLLEAAADAARQNPPGR